MYFYYVFPVALLSDGWKGWGVEVLYLDIFVILPLGPSFTVFLLFTPEGDYKGQNGVKKYSKLF